MHGLFHQARGALSHHFQALEFVDGDVLFLQLNKTAQAVGLVLAGVDYLLCGLDILGLLRLAFEGRIALRRRNEEAVAVHLELKGRALVLDRVVEVAAVFDAHSAVHSPVVFEAHHAVQRVAEELLVWGRLAGMRGGLPISLMPSLSIIRLPDMIVPFVELKRLAWARARTLQIE